MRGGAVFRAVGVMPSKDDGAGTDTFDRISPMGNAEHRQRPSPYGVASGTLPVTIRLNGCRPCSGTHCRIRTFTTAPPLITYLQPPVEDYADLLVPHCIGIDFALMGLPVFLFVFQCFIVHRQYKDCRQICRFVPSYRGCHSIRASH